MSKHDTHFFNMFSMIIGGLIVVALGIFALARVVAGHTQVPETYSDPKYLASVAARIEPFARVVEPRLAADREHTIPSGRGTGPARDRRDDGGKFEYLMRVTRSA